MRVSRLFNKDDDITVHSSTYAEVAYKKRIGSETLRSFSQRQRLEKNRQTIKQYRESKLGSHERVHTEFSSTQNNNQPGRIGQSARSGQHLRPIQSFREPGGRSYNPYS